VIQGLKNRHLLEASVKKYFSVFILGWIVLSASPIEATTRYVDLNNPSPTPPYTNWPTAATNIQTAIDAASAGDLILVTNGDYAVGGRRINGNLLTNRVSVTKSVTVQSVNGPTMTFIRGNPIASDEAVRCVYLTNNARLIGFTLTDGATHISNIIPQDELGGGVYCASSNCVVSNCVISGNIAGSYGGGAYSGTLQCCVLFGNSVTNNPGGGGGGIAYARAYNCLLMRNSADEGGGAFFSSVVNCTVVSNTASSQGGGVYDNNNDVPAYAHFENDIVYYNTAKMGSNYFFIALPTNMAFCCTQPLPLGRTGNITNAPQFVDAANGDFHLSDGSPCINSGYNTYITMTNDLDGHPRASGGTVDIGAYEYQAPTSVLSYVWAQQYGLPTDGSGDFADTDGDGFNNWQEWLAGTVPTNSASVLIAHAQRTSDTRLVLSWQSVTGRTYFVQRATDFTMFQSLQSNIVGHAGSTRIIDSNATGGLFFYRVGIQP
jgi:hypothetical protein